MEVSRILAVDDHEPFRRFISSALLNQPELQIIAEAADGLAAVQKAEELRPDLILLDIGMPKLNGIEAARQIRTLSPGSKILFLSQESSADLVQAALSTGAAGYVVKSEAARELLPAVEAVLNGKPFVSASLSAHVPLETSDARRSNGHSRGASKSATFAFRPRCDRHVVQFYAHDSELLDNLIRLFRDSLNAGASVVAILTRAHQIGFEERLIAQGIDVNEAIQEGRLTIVDTDERLSQFMDADGLNLGRFRLQFEDMIERAKSAALGEDKRLVVFGEMVAVLCARQKYDTAMWLEDLWDELALTHSFYLCCAYPESAFQEKSKDKHYASICAQHSEVVSAF